MPRVLCAGHVNWDVTFRLDGLPEPDGEARILDQHQAGGGSAANVAAALASLGAEAGLLGSVGDDEHGHLARRELEAAGVDCAGLVSVPGATTVKYLLVDGAGRVMVLGNVGVNEGIGPADIDAALVGAADHVHLTGQRPDTAAEVARAAVAAGTTVSVDPGRRLGERDFAAALARADLVFANEREADALDGIDLDGPAGDGPTVVRKRGAAGATVVRSDGSLAHPGFDVDATDTAGAGDAFAAGFLAARLDGAGDDRALAVANACGTIAARTRGARSAPTWDAVQAYLDEHGGPG